MLSEHHIHSVQALHNLLTTSIAEPEATLAALRMAATSQTSLAKFCEPSLNIVPMSLNHQKRVAAFVLGSYGRLDRLRIQLKGLFAPKSMRDQTSRAERSSIFQLKKVHEQKMVALLQDIYILQRAYDLRCAQALNYAAIAGQSTLDLARKEQAELDASFRLLREAPNRKVVMFPKRPKT